jgi:hypothetical protein
MLMMMEIIMKIEVLKMQCTLSTGVDCFISRKFNMSFGMNRLISLFYGD